MVGCNAPIIERTIKDLAQIEKDVLEGKVKREKTAAGGATGAGPEEGATTNESAAAEEESANTNEPHEISKIVTCLIIKPDIMKEVSVDPNSTLFTWLFQEDKVKEIMELIELNGITIVMDETKVLSDEIINSIYAASSQEYKGK